MLIYREKEEVQFEIKYHITHMLIYREKKTPYNTYVSL